jgi:hypothetical protein
MSSLSRFVTSGITRVDGESLIEGPDGVYVADVTNAAVLATGATTARSLAARLADIVSIEDFGVVDDPNGQYVSANTAAYQAAIIAASGAARLRHRAGLTVYHTGLFVNNGNLILEIDGSLILAPTNSGETINSCIGISANNVCIILGINGVIDGNVKNQAGNANGPYGAGGIVTGQNYALAPNAIWNDVCVYGPGTIQNTVNWAVSLYSVNRPKIIGTRLINSGSAPQFAQGATNGIFAFNYVSTCTDYGFAVYQGCSYISVNDNIFENVATVGVLNDGNSSTGYNEYPCHHISITNNKVLNGTTWGLSVLNSSIYTQANHYDIEISNNQLINCANNNTLNSSCIFLQNCSQVNVEKNLISGGGTTGQNNFAININLNVSFSKIVNNVVENLGVVGTGFGITVGGTNMTFEGNWVRDTQTTHTMQYGYFGSFGAGAVFRNNRADNLTAAGFDYTPANDSFIENYNPVVVAQLPAQGGQKGNRMVVVNAEPPTYNSTITGGGTETCQVIWNGSAWVAG